jgi:hypothetical protein
MRNFFTLFIFFEGFVTLNMLKYTENNPIK